MSAIDTFQNLIDSLEGFLNLIPYPYYSFAVAFFGIIVARSLIGIISGG